MIMLIALNSCDKKDYYHYINKDYPESKELHQLFPLLNTHIDYSKNRFTVINEIIYILSNYESIGSLNLFVNEYINSHPDDPYNSFYTLKLGSEYLKREIYDFAETYIHKSVMVYKDLKIDNRSVHKEALETLTEITQDKKRRVFYYKKLIAEHSEELDLGQVHYYLAEALEAIEEWDEAIKSYTVFLDYPQTAIPSEPDARDDILKKVGFYHADKKWIERDLNTLIWRIRSAVNRKDYWSLDKYRAYDFFVINWNSKYSDLKSSHPLDSVTLINMSLTFDPKVDPMSTETEAFLGVSGNKWINSIWWVYPKWYFYFKKVDYPQDPEIHGGWEWVGIFLGEKL